MGFGQFPKSKLIDNIHRNIINELRMDNENQLVILWINSVCLLININETDTKRSVEYQYRLSIREVERSSADQTNSPRHKLEISSELNCQNPFNEKRGWLNQSKKALCVHPRFFTLVSEPVKSPK